MTIRFAAAADIPGILDLLRQVGEVHHRIRPDLFRPDTLKYNEEQLLQIMEDPDRPIFIAAGDEGVLGYGFCVLKVIRDSTVRNDCREFYIDDLCVDEKYRGTGIAAALYRHICGYAREKGCGSLTLNVWCGNEGAMKFYEKAGLTPRNITMEMKL